MSSDRIPASQIHPTARRLRDLLPLHPKVAARIAATMRQRPPGVLEKWNF